MELFYFRTAAAGLAATVRFDRLAGLDCAPTGHPACSRPRLGLEPYGTLPDTSVTGPIFQSSQLAIESVSAAGVPFHDSGALEIPIPVDRCDVLIREAFHRAP
jgi:hypothetical protein